ncbi:LysR family transcriptional regulator, partial [Pseudomonas syringae]
MNIRRSDPVSQVSDFDIRLLRLFKSVVEAGGFSAAESVLGSGRSAISQQMSAREPRRRLPLCQPGRAGVAPADAGRAAQQPPGHVHRARDGVRTGG